MIGISTKVWSHNTNSASSRTFVPDVRKSLPKQVATYGELIEEVAKVTYQNSRFFIFFRGQSSEHYTSGKVTNNTALFPSIYRDFGRRLTARDIANRFKNLDHATTIIIRMLSSQSNFGIDKLRKYPELAWSILQHYEICLTPLLDITQSLLVAASFALDKMKEGIVYVFGLPIITNGISYSIEDELLNIKLSSSCPPQAKRPFHQEAYLLSTFPSRIETRHIHLDCAKRLIAKFRLRDGGSFFGGGFSKLRKDALYPNSNDSLYEDLRAKVVNFPYPEQLPERRRQSI
jgi:hypothetical protein